jgi:dUTP pyrophosphatase
MTLSLYYTKLSDQAITPTRTHANDVWYDLYSTESHLLLTNKQYCFMTDICVQLPNWYFGRIAPRSGLAKKYSIHVLWGIIDQWYIGNIGIILINLWSQDLMIQAWDRIAQLIIMPYLSLNLIQVEWFTQTHRWTQWFGSSWA